MTRRFDEPLLIADVGGTKAVLAWVDPRDDVRALTDVRTYATREYASFDRVLEHYLASSPEPTRAVLAVAGPVVAGHARITNLPWEIAERSVEKAHGIHAVRLLNDLEATAWSLPSLEPSDLVVLQDGVRHARGSIAVVAPGTGLGEAFLTWDGTAYSAHATEGGHADFAPNDDAQDRLLSTLRAEYDHVSVERVCSGYGIGNIYRHLARQGAFVELPAVQAQIDEAADITPVVVAAALEGESPLCVQTVRMFSEILAAEAGNFALKTLATGGVVLAGGLPRRLLPFLQTPVFLSRFAAKGRFADWLERTPLSVLRDPLAPLHGAAAYAASQAASTEGITTTEVGR